MTMSSNYYSQLVLVHARNHGGHQRRVDHRGGAFGHHTSYDEVLSPRALTHLGDSLGERELNASRLKRARRLSRDVVGDLASGFQEFAIDLYVLGHPVARANARIMSVTSKLQYLLLHEWL